MAEQVARIKLQAIVEGLEGFDQLKGAFKGLQQAIGPTDAQITKARKDILEFGQAAGKTEQVIRGQIDALKGLQAQASIGSTVYRQLKKDVSDLGGAYKEAASGVKQFTDAQLKSQIVGSKPGTFDKQIAALRRDLQDLSVYSDQYTQKLTEIQRRQLPFNTALGRQNVIAGFEAYAQGGKGGAALPALPDTTAGLNQRLSELNAELVNVTRGGTDWVRVSREIVQVQREMARTIPTPEVQAAQARLQASRAINSGSGFRAFSYRADQLAARANAEAQAALERRQTLYSRPIGPPPPSDLFRNIAGISNATASNQLQLMGRSYGEVAASIRQTTAASDGSINSLRAQRTAWEALRNTLGNNKQALREVDRELDQIDRKLEKRSRGGGGIGPKLQAAGAIASGAIFGGPEGFLGGLGGAALGSIVPGLGTVGGAFAGAAAGGAISSIRQQTAGIANYVRDLNLAKTTLAQASAGQGEYNALLRSARRISSDYAVSLKETINGYAQVAVAARANGLTLKETENVYRGLVASGVAFGKSQEDLDAIVRATVQVLSKGKLSAEELGGQIGERLPGAVAKFATATNRSLPELAKALEQGQVPIADFVKFANKQLKDYDEIAKIIGASPEKAGARLQVALETAGETYGGFFQQTGAYFQDGITQVISWLNENETTIKEWVTVWVNAGREIVSVIKAIADVLGPVVTGFADFIKRFYEFMQYNPGVALGNMVRGGVRNLLGLQDQKPLKSSDLFPQFKPGAFGSGSGAVGGGKTDLDTDALKKAQDKARREAEQLAAEQQRLNEQLAKARIALDNAVHRNAMELIRKQYEYALELDQKRRDNWVKSQTGAARSAAGLIAGFLGESDSLGSRGFGAQEAVKAAQQQLKSAQAMAATTVGASGGGGLGFSASQLQAASREASKFTGIANMCSESVKAFYKSLGISLPGVTAWADTVRNAGQVMRDWSKLQPGDIVATGRPGDTPHVGVYTGGNNVFHQSRSRGLTVGNYPDLDYFKSGYFVRPGAIGGGKLPTGMAAAIRRDVSAEGAVDVAQADLQKAQQLLKAEQEQIKNLKALVGEGFVLDFTQQIREQNAEMQNSVQITELRNRLQLEGQRPEYIDGEIKKAEVAKRIAQENQAATEALDRLTKAGESGSTEAQRLRDGMAQNNQQLAEFKRLTDEATTAQIAFNDALRVRQDNRIGMGFREGAQQYVESIGTMREATAQLAQTGIKGVEDAIFSLVTTGTANFREFAASILKDTTRMIIQQLILRTIMQIIGAIPGGGGGSALAKTFEMPGAGFPTSGFKFADGGIVDRPTLFKFANGGAMNTGLMGEAGPEAIIPLRRGRDGKLGVAGGGSSTNVTVNVDATGSSVQGNSGQGEALGRAISQAVQAELIKQRRPGGLLAA